MYIFAQCKPYRRYMFNPYNNIIMYLIADSGSTKTEWCLTDGISYNVITTGGINPVLQAENDICDMLYRELVAQMPPEEHAGERESAGVESVFFYGAGCIEEKIPFMESVLRKVFNSAGNIFVGSDLLGAARALCGNEPGIACILGTGSNSCLYDGKDIVENVSPLGFILGDEGSGAYIGKRLVGDVLKRQFPDELCRLFFSEMELAPAAIIQKVYREPMPNRFLASLSNFCYKNRDNEVIHDLLVDCFDEFFKRNVLAYTHNKGYVNTKHTVHFVGSVAYYYSREVEEAAVLNGFRLGRIVRRPIEELYRYHSCGL